MVVVGVRGGERRPLISLSFLDPQTILTASNYSKYPVTILNFAENQIWMIRFLVHSFLITQFRNSLKAVLPCRFVFLSSFVLICGLLACLSVYYYV